MTISGNYRQLTDPAEIDHVAAKYDLAWQDDVVPQLQYELTERELHNFRHGIEIPPYDGLIQLMRRIPPDFFFEEKRLLDVGAGVAHYKKLFELISLPVHYQGFDYSEHFRAIARKMQDADYDVGDARSLPYRDDSFDIVLSGATIMHVRQYRRVIEELARVSNRYVILHRTPIVHGETIYFVKEAYDRIQCLEIWFNEQELLTICDALKLERLMSVDIFWDRALHMGHRSYLFRKAEALPHYQV